jgi:hypothetical protein
VTRSFHRVVGEDYSLLLSSRRQSEESFFFEYREYGGRKLFRNVTSILPISMTSYIRRTQSSEGDIQTFDHLHTNRAGIEIHLEALPQNCQKQLLSLLFWLMANLTHSFLMYLFHASTCFEQQVLIIRRAKLY